LVVARSRLKPPGLHGPNRPLVQTAPQRLLDAYVRDLTARFDRSTDENNPLKLAPARVLRIFRIRSGQNARRFVYPPIVACTTTRFDAYRTVGPGLLVVGEVKAQGQ